VRKALSRSIDHNSSACPLPIEASPRAAKVFRSGTQPRVLEAEIPPPPRNAASLRAESARQRLVEGPRLIRPIAKARTDFARALDTIMAEHWVRGEEALSNCAIGRACGLDEKHVRKWRSDEAPMPAAALALIPSQLFTEVVDYL